MSRTIAERARLYGWTEQQVVEHDEKIRAEVAKWPPLTGRQMAVIRTLMRPGSANGSRVEADREETLPLTPPAAPRPQAADLPPEMLAPRTPGLPSATSVYVLGAAQSGHVKIGLSVDPRRRARGISTMSAVPVRLLWSTPGSHDLEAALHDHFKDLRMHGEWFDFTGRDAVAEVAAAADYFRVDGTAP